MRGDGERDESVIDEARAAAAVGQGPDADVVSRLVGRFAAEIAAAPEPSGTDPYSRQVVLSRPDVEVMIARWRPGTRCAPHDHGGSRGFVTPVEGDFAERRFTWRDGDLVVSGTVDRPVRRPFGIGRRVVHDMEAGDGGVTLHVYAPRPERMSVFDLDRREVLDAVGNVGAWIPDDDTVDRVPFDVARSVADGEVSVGGPAVVWIGYTTHYRGGSAEFAVAAQTLGRERAAARPDAEVRVVALHRKDEWVDAMADLAADGRQIRELHFVGHAGMYGPMFGSVAWPEQFSPHEWRTMEIPFAPDGEAWFRACRTARWFAPFFATTFGVTTHGNQGYTTVSARPDRFGWAGRRPAQRPELYLVATPGRRSHGIAGSVRKYAGARVEEMVACGPTEDDRSYDKVAELYDAAYVDITVREREWAWVLGRVEARRREVGRPLRVVEVGCGNGALLRALDDRGHLSSGVGLDASAGMVERARERSEGRERLTFDRIDGPRIDHPDAAADVVLSFLSFRYLDWDPLMEEVRRVLAPAGRLWVVDMVERPLRVREAPVLARSWVSHLTMSRRHPRFARDLQALTSHPDWKAMVRRNPIRAEHEYRWYLESRFPPSRLELLTVGHRQRVVAFDSGPLTDASTAPLSYP